MLDRSVLRLGGGAAMTGAVVGLVFNLLHPRAGDALDDAAAELALISDDGMWQFTHYMLGISVVLGLAAILVIGRSFPDQPAASWGLLAAGVGIASTVMLLSAVALDGFAMERLASAGADAAGAEVLQSATFALLTIGIGTWFGLTPMLFGIAMLSSLAYPRWLAYIALGGGTLGFITGTIQWFSGPTTLTMNGLFLIASLAVTVWFFFAGWALWQRTEAASGAAVAPPAV